MSVDYRRDDQRRRIVVRITEGLDPQDLLSVIDRQQREGTWEYGLLYDARFATIPLSTESLQHFLDHMADSPAGAERRGAVAIVATDADIYATACRYLALARRHLRMSVFRDIDEAHAWLDLQPAV